jgi:hypothetical protein
MIGMRHRDESRRPLVNREAAELRHTKLRHDGIGHVTRYGAHGIRPEARNDAGYGATARRGREADQQTATFGELVAWA